MPWLPSSSSSPATTRCSGHARQARAPGAAGPTWTWRPRVRSPAREAGARPASEPSASSETCVPPSLASRTRAPTSAQPSPARVDDGLGAEVEGTLPGRGGRRRPRPRGPRRPRRPAPRTARPRRSRGRRAAPPPAAARRAAAPGTPWRTGSRAARPRPASTASGSGTRLTAARGTASSSANEPQPGEAGLELVGADLLVARPGTAAQVPQARTNGAVTRSPDPDAVDPGPDRGHRARPTRGRPRAGSTHVVVVAGEGVPVAAAQPGHLDPDDDPAGGGHRVGDLADRRGLAEHVLDQRAHGQIMPVRAGRRTLRRPASRSLSRPNRPWPWPLLVRPVGASSPAQLGEAAQQVALLVVEPGGDLDVDVDVQVAAAGLAQVGRAQPVEGDGRARAGCRAAARRPARRPGWAR